MSERRTPGTTCWLRPSTLEQINKKKRDGETADNLIKRALRRLR